MRQVIFDIEKLEILNFEVRILCNICYCLFSAPQNQFKAEKKIVLLVNVFCLTNKKFPFSVKRKRNQILHNIRTSKLKIRQISKSANHRMTYIRQKL